MVRGGEGTVNRRIRELYFRMIDFDAGQPALIQHFTKLSLIHI